MRETDLDRELREIVGETKVTTNPFERWVYAADFVPIPEIIKGPLQDHCRTRW